MDFLKELKPFIAGGLAGCIATCFVQPMDMVKVRMQIAGQGQRLQKAPSSVAIAQGIIRNEGAGVLWTGLSAGLLRQVIYGSSRLGLFRALSDKARARRKDGSPLPLYLKLSIASFSGALASFLGNPADLALVRMQADSLLPAAEQVKYRGVGDALVRIAKSDGVTGWWVGCAPTIARAVLMNGAMLATNDEVQERIGKYFGGETSFTTRSIAATVSGFTAATASLPADLVRVRLQKMTPDPVTGKLPYSGFLQCAASIAKDEGILTFWRGLGTYTARIAPHVIITLSLLPYTTALVAKITG